MSSSNDVFDILSLDGFSFSSYKSKFSLLPLPATNQSLPETTGNINPKELVFLGELSYSGGLKLFCDLIDLLMSYETMPVFKITFIGKSAELNGLNSHEYIQLRSLKWETKNIVWQIKSELSIRDLISYVSKRRNERLVIIPEMVDLYSTMKNQLDCMGVTYVDANFMQNLLKSFTSGIFLYF